MKKKKDKDKEKLRRFSTYMFPTTRRAIKLFAAERGVYEYQIIDAALRKCLPEKFFE